MTHPEIESLLESNQCETARRRCLQALAVGGARGDHNDLLKLLHRACRFLGDQAACREALARLEPSDADQELDLLLLQAEDFKYFGAGRFYRDSDACRQGYSHWEYTEMMGNKAREALEKASALARSDEQKRCLAASIRICEEGHFSAMAKSVNNVLAPGSPARKGACRLQGRIAFADDAPARNLIVTLGLEVAQLPRDTRRYTNTNLEVYEPDHSVLETVCVQTDENGGYCFEKVPAGTHEFLSVNLDPQLVPVAVRFMAHEITVRDDETTELDAVIQEWESASARLVQASLPAVVNREGRGARLVAADKLCNPFDYAFPRQLLELDLPEGVSPDPEKLVLLGSDHPDTPVPFQVAGRKILYFSDLSAGHDRLMGLYQGGEAINPGDDSPLKLVVDADGSAVVSTGKAHFRLPYGEGHELLPPIMQVKGVDGVWRGQGRMFLPDGVSLVRCGTTVIERGPLRLQLKIDYVLSNNMSYGFRLTFHRDEEYVLVRETCPALEGAGFIFSLPEFMHGRCFRNYEESLWYSLEPRQSTLGLLKETVSFGVPLECFGLLMGKDGLEEKDCVGVFTIRRGEWIDRAFEKVCNGPAPAGYSHEQEWPYPEMIGSTFSMITAETDENDCFFRFNAFDGERQWGLMVSSFDRNDGRYKALSEHQHKNSCPRLQEFKTWRLDEPSAIARPSLLVQAERLPELRRRKEDARFAAVWGQIEQMRPNGGGQWAPSAAGAFRAVLNADPRLIWNKKRELTAIAGPHARSVLLGRDKSEEYSPVASRAVTPWIEDYDLIAASGVFTPEEERLVRSHHMLMGHMYLQKDLMNWTFNARNANFEADRVDTVGAAGLCFRDNPDGKGFIQHAQSRMARIIDTYCTPGSGKWYENPSCYYLSSLNCWTSLFVHMSHHGLITIEDVPRMKDFLQWGALLLTPPTPGYEDMRFGLAPAAYDACRKKRRIAPIGDHAKLGPSIPENYALIAACYRESDPEFADLLRWAYHAAGADGAYHGSPLLFFANADDWMLTPPLKSPVLPSRKLEGFGAVLRGNQNQNDESFLLLKLGPGGYRYHNTEGSIIFFADGKPLIYDGGEAGETWRHSTLSFYDAHTMLVPGHVERFHDFGHVGFTQGVSPKVLKPGEPNFLNDTCRPESIEVGYRNFHEPNPAHSRSLFWVKDEYLVMHDSLNLAPEIPSHWHLQVVADSHAGDLESGWRFKGRFGTDLQVLMPEQSAAKTKIEQMPILDTRPVEKCFSMRHLQVDGVPGTDHYLALLRPLPAGKTEVKAETVSARGQVLGLRVSGEGIDDLLLFARDGMDYAREGIAFNGRYAQVLVRPSGVTLAVQEGSRLSARGYVITSTGPAACLHIAKDGITLACEGAGEVAVSGEGVRFHLTTSGGIQTLRL